MVETCVVYALENKQNMLRTFGMNIIFVINAHASAWTRSCIGTYYLLQNGEAHACITTLNTNIVT